MRRNRNPPAGVQPELWHGMKTPLAQATHPPIGPDLGADQDARLAGQSARVLAYLVQLGRQPLADPRFSAGDRRYLAGPLIVGDPAWGATTPTWLRDAVPIARLGLLLAGEHDCASEEEAVAYLMAASLAAPLQHDWAEIYFWLCARVLARWSKVQEADFWTLLGETVPRRELRPDQTADLRRLLHDLRRSVERHARTPQVTHPTTTHKGAHL